MNGVEGRVDLSKLVGNLQQQIKDLELTIEVQKAVLRGCGNFIYEERRTQELVDRRIEHMRAAIDALAYFDVDHVMLALGFGLYERRPVPLVDQEQP